jgi:cytochrome c553
MMKPQAYEALQKAKALFRHPAEAEKDDIPAEATAVEPIRKPRVVLIPPTDAPKFTKETMKAEHKNEEAQQAFAKMSVTQACEACLKMGITKPSRIAELTGKPAKQIYTAMWQLKQRKKKARVEAKAKAKAVEIKGSWGEMSDDFDPRREPTAWEDAHMVVLKSREQYEEEIAQLQDRIGQLLLEKQEQATIIKYLEGRTK